ncbi:MAG: UDP-glucose 4-epimerase GalE [Sphaerochaetaceae bacterium]|nr:UDP-glucose 4-epimerase GalE [Sphaerochaetaceae bacterium]
MVLITGGAGFIGSHTCVELINAGYEVVVVDNLVNSHEESLNRVEKITGKRPVFYKANICDQEALSAIFDKHNIEAVIHFAGLKAVGESVEKPLEYFSNNLDASMVLCKVMIAHNVNNLVFSSSATVYSGDNLMPLNEQSKTGNCTNPYGWTKYMGEQIFKAVSLANPKLSIVLLRYFNPVGAHESGLIGEDPQGIPNNLMPYVSQVAIGRREKLTVYGNDYDTPDGTGVRDYIHVVDLARAHVLAIKYAKENKGCEVFNIGTGKGYSVLDIVKAYEKACGKQIPYVIGKRRAGDLATVYADTSKALKGLGFKAEFDLDRMCSDSWRWQKMNPNGFEK